MYITCDATINLRRPVRQEKVRVGFQPHWRTVYIYECPECHHERRVFASRFIGKTPTPEIGAITCGAFICVD